MRDELSELTRRTTHDLNNQMAAILTFADLVLEELPEGHPARADIEAIRAAGVRTVAKTRELSKLATKVAEAPVTMRAA